MSLFSTPTTKVIKYCMFISFLLTPTSLYTQVTFEDVTEAAGVELNYQCKGSAWGDFNNDGYLDLYVIAWDSNIPNALFWNHENGEFTNGTAEAGLEDIGVRRMCVRLGDYNNDGFLDIFIGKDGEGALYRNNRDSTFTDVADALELNVSRFTFSAAWGDYDNDGDIDLYLCTTHDDDILFENDVDSTGVFIDVTANAGIGGGNNARSVIWFDYNNDGYLDIYEGIESVGPNILYKNNGNKTFTDETGSAGVPDPVQTLSTAAGDYNNDGWMDIYNGGVSGLETPNILYRNTENDTFYDATIEAQVPGPESSHTQDVVWVNYDNDILLDLYLLQPGGMTSILYHNEEGPTFSETDLLSRAGSEDTSCAWGDYNNDGFMDVYITGIAGVNTLYKNNGNSNHWLIVNLEGVVNNREGIGARVIVHPGGMGSLPFSIMSEVSGGSGQCSHNSIQVEFGLGSYTTADVVVEWPKIGEDPAIRDTLRNVAADQSITIRENSTNGQLIAVTNLGTVDPDGPDILSILDSDLVKEIATISYHWQADPMGVAASPDSNYLAVVLSGEDRISVVDVADPNNIFEYRQFSVDNNDLILSKPVGVVMDSNNYIYLSKSSTNLVRVFTIFGQPLDDGGILVGSKPQFLDFSPDNSLLAVACKDADSVFVIDALTLTKVDSFPSSI